MNKKTEFFHQKDVVRIIDPLFKEYYAILKEVFLNKNVDIQHIGSSAIPHALTKKDLDIQIRVPEKYFEIAVKILAELYKEHHSELWSEQFAIMTHFENGIHIDFVITVINSKYDNFYKVRDYFIANPVELEKYNTLKLKFQGKDYLEYTRAKRIFFTEMFGEQGDMNL
ncbi:MAG: GrpB family protein [Candidatus Nomurabacteria bacterium]|nr:GrpB family protein [Candidatus Nomurabacteria bacterium]